MSLAGNLGHFTWVVQQLQEQCYPFLSACVALCVSKQWYGSQCWGFLTHIDVDACKCTQGLNGHHKRVCTERWLWKRWGEGGGSELTVTDSLNIYWPVNHVIRVKQNTTNPTTCYRLIHCLCHTALLSLKMRKKRKDQAASVSIMFHSVSVTWLFWGSAASAAQPVGHLALTCFAWSRVHPSPFVASSCGLSSCDTWLNETTENMLDHQLLGVFTCDLSTAPNTADWNNWEHARDWSLPSWCVYSWFKHCTKHSWMKQLRTCLRLTTNFLVCLLVI